MSTYQPNRPPPIKREIVAPAPTLMGNNRCSDCNVTAVWAGNHDLRVCPECYNLLWRQDWGERERLSREAERLARATREAERQRDREERMEQRQVKDDGELK